MIQIQYQDGQKDFEKVKEGITQKLVLNCLKFLPVPILASNKISQILNS